MLYVEGDTGVAFGAMEVNEVKTTGLCNFMKTFICCVKRNVTCHISKERILLPSSPQPVEPPPTVYSEET